MGPGDIVMLIAILFCVMMSAYFSATETAFSTLNRVRVKNMAEDGNRKAKAVVRTIDNFDSLLSTILIGNNVVNIIATVLATIFFTHLLNNEDKGSTLATIVLTAVILIFGEVTPKTIAKKYPDSFAMATVGLIRAIGVILFPLSFLIGLWQKLISKIFKGSDDKGMTEEELISIIEEAEEEGDFGKDESDLIKSAIEFNELEVGDIYTPRIDVVAIDIEDSKEEIRDLFIRSGYSRIPVYRDDLDNIIGLLYYKDFFKSETVGSIEKLLKPTMFVAKTQKINDLLKILQEKQMHLAVVTDEFGSTAGIVTLEDILEEIVGDIWDEHDKKIEEIKTVGEGEYIISGKANIEKVFDEIGVDEEPEALTVNGWAMAVLGRIPTEGDVFEADGLSAKVLKMNGRRIENLHIVKLPPKEEEDE